MTIINVVCVYTCVIITFFWMIFLPARDECFNKALFNRCAELGLLGITIPTKYGGSGEACGS